MNDLNLDSVNFDPRRYISNFLKTNTIKDLIKKNNEIEEQIKEHDHQIQSLVFENYSKFISSIDTVKQMKTDISKVDDKLKKLDHSMDHISELALKIDNTFSVKRKEIQKLDTINKDLQKLKNLCEFPDILKSDLQYYKSLEKADDKPYQVLFEKSVASYKECFNTLNQFKTEPLIAPIFKESINKVEEMRSILWSLQSQLKSRSNSKDLKSITKKFLTVTEQQISPLRTYFKKSKQKLSENCLANQKYFVIEEYASEEQIDSQSAKAINEQRLAKALEENKTFLNESYWLEFQQDSKFISEDLLPILKHTQDIDQLIINSCKQAFVFVLTNFCDSVQKNCHSTIHFSLLLEKANEHFRNVIKNTYQESLKAEFEKVLSEKLEQLCTSHVSISFTKLKLAVLHQYIKQKEFMLTLKTNEDTQKEVYARINPIKGFVAGNFMRLLTALKNIREREYFSERKKYLDLLFAQIQELAKLLCYILSTPSCKVSEQAYSILGYSKLLATQRKSLEEAILKFKLTPDCGLTYLYNHNLLQILSKTLWVRLLSDFGSLFGEQPKDTATELFKKALNKNLCNLSFHYVVLVEQVYCSEQKQVLYFEDAAKIVEELVQISSYIFPESRRNIPKKPSLLNNSDRSYSFQTEVMLAKKAHMFDKRDSFTRSALLSAFTKGTLKNWLRTIRIGTFSSSKFESQVYCLVQLCYEMASVDEQSLISAYFYLIRGQYYRSDNVKVDKGVLDSVYSVQRTKTKI